MLRFICRFPQAGTLAGLRATRSRACARNDTEENESVHFVIDAREERSDETLPRE